MPPKHYHFLDERILPPSRTAVSEAFAIIRSVRNQQNSMICTYELVPTSVLLFFMDNS